MVVYRKQGVFVLIEEELQQAITSGRQITDERMNTILSPLFGDSISISSVFILLLESGFYALSDNSPPQHIDTFAVNYYKRLIVALQNGLDPNEILPYEDGEAGCNNIMWAVIGNIRCLEAAPRILEALLDYGGNPNLQISIQETIFREVDFFFYLAGENLCENLLRCWLLLAAYGGDKDSADHLP